MRKVKVHCFKYKRHIDIYVNRVDFSTDKWLSIFNIFQQKDIIVLVEADEETVLKLIAKERKRKKNFCIWLGKLIATGNAGTLVDSFSSIDASTLDGMFIVHNKRRGKVDEWIKKIELEIGSMVKKGEADISCSINFPENEVFISLAKEEYDFISVKNQIYEIFNK